MTIRTIVTEHRVPLLIAAAALIAVIAMIWIFSPSLGKLEDKARQAGTDRKVAEKGAVDNLDAAKAKLDSLEAGHAQDRNSQEARISELEDRLGRQASELRAQSARTQQLLAERTAARAADITSLSALDERDLYARVAATLRKVGP